jgi:hypothetical protein
LETIKINLATFEYQDKRITYPILILAILIIFALSGLSFYVGSRNRTEIKEYEKKIEQLENTSLIKQKISDNKYYELTSGEIDTLKEDVNFVNQLIDMDTFPWGKLLDSLERLVPSGITLSNFNISEDLNKVGLQGMARSIKDIGVFIEQLNGSKVYGNNELISLTVSEENSDQVDTAGKLDILFEIESYIDNRGQVLIINY